VRVGTPRHVSLLTGQYRHLTADAIATQRSRDIAEARVQLEHAQRAFTQQIKVSERALQQHEQTWQLEEAKRQRHIDEIQTKLSSLEEDEQRRIKNIENGLAVQEEKRQAAKRQLELLYKKRQELRQNIAWWQGYQETQTGVGVQGEQARRMKRVTQAQQILTEIKRKREKQRFWIGNIGEQQYQNTVHEATRQIIALQEVLNNANQAIDTLSKELQENELAQWQPQVALKKAEDEKKRLEVARTNTYFTDQMYPYKKRLKTLEQEKEQGETALEECEMEVRNAKDEKSRVEDRLEDIKSRLADIKTEVVNQAQLVAATVSSVYLNPNLLKREFDVVLVDEISMISLVGVLLVASRATKFFIAAGDPMQLAPILKTVCKEYEREKKMPEAVKWLGQDLLTYLGITIFDAINNKKDCILLTEQGRSHPKIMAPLNHYVYQDMLTNRPETEYAPPIGPLPSCPLMVVDSSRSPDSEAHKPSANEARVNDHHVEVAVALIPQILATLPEQSPSADPSVPRIGVLVPYRSQHRRMLRALRKANLDKYVHVGTINTAQALEFEVVILDTVEAPSMVPFKFTFDAVLDNDNMATGATRLLTVGHGRARHKLIYIANIDYLHKHRPNNPENKPEKQRLLIELVDWAYREGHTSSMEILEAAHAEDEGA